MNRAELYYSEAVRRTEEQLKTRQHFDTMATAVLAASGVILSIMALSTSEWACWSIYPAIAVVLSFAAVAISTIVGLWLRKWQFQPPLSTLYKHMESLEYEDEALAIWTAKWMSDAVENNKTFLTRKSICLRAAYIFLACEVISLGVFIFSVAA